MKIISVVDKIGSAIWRLEEMNRVRLEHIDYVVLPFHPKRPSPEQIADMKKHLVEADVVNYSYWKSGVVVRKMFADLCEGKPNILIHHNEHNINDTEKDHWEWKDMEWDKIICKNGWQKKELEKQGYKPIKVNLACEFSDFNFVPELTKDKNVLYVGQIKKVKGVREIAEACKQLGYKLLIVGKVSEAGYGHELIQKYSDVIEWAQDVSNGEMKNIFAKARVYCANSDDGTESGTMPILEAMVSGIPVVTRKIGLVRDCGQHKKNMWIREGGYTDIEDLKKSLMMVMENDDIADDLRENAWRTVRQYHPVIQAREYDKIFRKVLYKDSTIVSIIMPTFSRPEALAVNLQSLSNQSYKNIEVVVCDDGSNDVTDPVIKSAKKMLSIPIKYIDTGDTEKYGLAKARNMGLIEAIGDIVVFCDDRLKMEQGAVEGFVKMLENNENKKVWLWGNKGTFKSFVENFSATWRKTVIEGGMFNERIMEYGGTTQEISNRFNSQGIKFVWCPQSLAEPIIGTHSKSKNRQQIIRMKILLYKLGLQ